MHWWKKFLSNFFSDKKVNEPTEIYKEDQHKNDQPEMKTRVIYQYPKGEFRFPLIKDEQIPARPSGTGTWRRPSNNSKRPSSERLKRSRQEEKPAGRSRQDRLEKAKSGSRKIEPNNHQPFEPTHIPSPIYGFNRPIKKKAEAEFPEIELPNIKLKTRVETDEQQLESTMEKEVSLGQGVLSNDQSGKLSEKEESYNKDAEEDTQEKIGAVEIIDRNGNRQEKDFNEDKVEPAPIPVEQEDTENSLNQVIEPISDKEEVFLDKNIKEIETPPAKIESESHHSPVEEDTGKFVTSTGMDTHEKAAETDVDPVETEKVTFKGNHEDEAAAAVDLDYEFLKEEKLVEHKAAPEPIDATTEQREVQKEEDMKPRSHLPFNVLMLSEDKRKWQKQKQKERESKKREDYLKAVEETAEAETAAAIESAIDQYEFPGIRLLKPPVIKEENTEWLNEQTALLDETMENFNVKAKVVKASQGPSVTRFEVQPDKGVKVNKITNLSNDIKLSMAARDIRMEAPIPGTRSIGIELPNKESRPVQISEIIGNDVFLRAESPLTAALGLDISGEPIVTDLRKMPHGLIAGATGSGKSVCINSILVSLLYKARPDELKLMLIDPKMVELAPYNHIPHLVSPVITDVKAATAALKWAVDEMERRYELFVHAGVRDIGRFNELAKTKGQKGEHLPYIVIVIDELADLMMVAPAEVEESICRIAQKARACGIHLLIATQRPSVDVITGLIKANVPTRIAFAVSSQVDSRTVIDVSGAEKLLGRGDMLFLNNGSVKPVRLQGTFVSDEEIDGVIEHVRSQGKPNYLFQQDELLKKAEIQENEDELFMDACEFVVKQGHASTSLLQRQFRIGYNRAARLMEMMEEQEVISGANGSKPRDVLIKEAELELIKDSLVH